MWNILKTKAPVGETEFLRLFLPEIDPPSWIPVFYLSSFEGPLCFPPVKCVGGCQVYLCRLCDKLIYLRFLRKKLVQEWWNSVENLRNDVYL